MLYHLLFIQNAPELVTEEMSNQFIKKFEGFLNKITIK